MRSLFFIFWVADATVAVKASVLRVRRFGDSGARRHFDVAPPADDRCDTGELQNQLAELSAEKAKLDQKCDADIKHYRSMNKASDKQIQQLKPMVAAKKDESDIAPLYREHYSIIMCSKIHAAFIYKEEDARRDIMELCSSDKSLTEFPLPREEDAVLHEDPLLSTRLLKQPSNSSGCDYASDLEKQVDSARGAKEKKEQYCEQEVPKLKADLSRKRKEENDLWLEYDRMSNKPKIKKKTAAEVKTKYCTVVQQNYNVDEAAIKSFYNSECIPP